MSRPEPSDEEMRAALDEQLSRVSVPDVLMQSVVTMVNLGARRLGLAAGPEERDLGQAKLAIDAARALMPLLGPEESAPLRQAMSQLQMAYAQEAGGADEEAAAAPPEPGAAPPTSSSGPDEEARRRAEEEAERAKARARIWTPGRP